MTKKVLLSILLTIFLLCSVFGATFAFAAEEPAGDAVALSSTSEKLATYSMTANLPSTGYDANTVMEFKDGDATIATITVDLAAAESSYVNGPHEIAKDSTFTLVPGNGYSIKKVLFASPNTIMAPFTIDTAQGKAISLEDKATQKLLTQAGVSYTEGNYTRGVEFKPDYVATEQTPYTFKSGSSTIPYSTICLIYEKLPVTETVSANKSWGSQWLDAGPIKIGVLNTGPGSSSSGSMIKTSSSIEIKPAPGYVILSVSLNSTKAGDVLSSANYLTGVDGLDIVKGELGFTFTGFEVGKDYVIGNRLDAEWYVRDIIVTYIEHDHTPEGLTPNHNDANHWDDCICRAKVNEQAHTFVDGEITKQPGNGLPGEQLQTCQVCSNTIIKYLPCPIDDPELTVELASKLACNGTEQAQKVTIKVGDVVLVQDVDYTLSNNLQTNAGDYTLTITGIGKYSGERTLDFSIEKGIIERPWSSSDFPEYDGDPHTYLIKTDNTRYTISGNRQTEVGTYVAEVTLTDEAYANYRWEETTERTITYTFEITKGKVKAPSEDSTIFTYNGQPQTYSLSANSKYCTIGGDSRTQTNAGTYTITVSLNEPNNYQWADGTEGTRTYSFVIAKANYDMTGVKFENATVTYNGQVHSLEATNLPDGVQVSYDNNGQTNAGTYTVTANFVGDSANYNAIESLTAELVIEKANYDITDVVFDGKTVTYNGQVHSLQATNLPDGVQVSYKNNDQTNAGKYTVIANFVGDSTNYNAIESLTAELVIEKANYDMAGIKFENATVTYNGQVHSLEATNLPDGVQVSYKNNDQTNAGKYTVIANFTGDSVNYNAIESITAKLVINKANYDMSGVEFANQTVTYTGSKFYLEATNLPDGVQASYENNGQANAGTYTVTANFVGDFDNYNTIDSKTATLTINKANVTKPEADTTSFVYTGSALTYEIAPNNLYTVSGNVQTNAGTYSVAIALTDKANYQWTDGSTDDISYSFAIAKATYDMTGVEFENTAVTYNGESHSILATNLPAGVTASYTGNGQKVVGEYTITVEFAGDFDNYNTIASRTATLTIVKANVAKPESDTTSFVYNTNAQTYTIAQSNLYAVSGNVQTNAGTYSVAIALNDKANYQWEGNSTADLVYSFVIAKANVAKPESDTTSFVYNTNAQTYAVAQSDLYTVSGNVQTNAGTYSVAIALNDKANYQWADGTTDDLSYSFVIAKANVTKPEADTTSFVYNTNAQTYTVAQSDLYTVSGNVQKLAGTYSVAIALNDKANYQWEGNSTADLAYSFVIAKATYDMSGVTFVSKTVKYNASEHEIALTGTLPAGVTVSYTNNKGTTAGIYNAVATFAYDSANYNAIADMTATLTINKDVQSHVNPETNKQEVIVSSEEGIDPTKELFVELVEKEVSDESYDEFLQDNQKVAVAYDIKLLQDSISVQPDSTLTIKILIPKELKGREFSIMHIHEGKDIAVEYTIDGDYAVFKTDKLSEFVFTYNMGSIMWLIVILAIAVLLEVGFLLFLARKNKQANSTKVLAAYPPFIFGMFIAEWQIVLVVVLTIAVVALAVVCIVGATKALNKQTAQVVQPAQPLPAEEDDNQKSVRIVKSFFERLSQSSDEVKSYYDTIKNELLSYTTVKSKISFKHETFKVGKNIVAKLKIRGKSLCLFLALDPNDYKGTKYKIRDMAEISNSKDIPTMYKINLPRRVEYAKALISDVMQKFGAQKNND